MTHIPQRLNNVCVGITVLKTDRGCLSMSGFYFNKSLIFFIYWCLPRDGRLVQLFNLLSACPKSEVLTALTWAVMEIKWA
jgi:hypothetical protein